MLSAAAVVAQLESWIKPPMAHFGLECPLLKPTRSTSLFIAASASPHGLLPAKTNSLPSPVGSLHCSTALEPHKANMAFSLCRKPFLQPPVADSPKKVTPPILRHLIVRSPVGVEETVELTDVVCVDVAVVPKSALFKAASDMTKFWPEASRVTLPFFNCSVTIRRICCEEKCVELSLSLIRVSKVCRARRARRAD